MLLAEKSPAPDQIAETTLISDAPITYQRNNFRLSLHSTLSCAKRRPELVKALRIVEQVNAIDNMYQSSHAERLHEEARLPFRISAEPFHLPEMVRLGITEYGQALSSYYNACNDLYDTLPADHKWKQYLDHNKPPFLLNMERGRHLFIRPDFILTDDEPILTEIETSPFGLALSHYLNDSYPGPTLDNPKVFIEMFRKLGSVCFGYTPYTQRYEGQFRYFASQLRDHGIDAVAAPMADIRLNGSVETPKGTMNTLYRCFYLHEATEQMLQGNVMPNGNPQIEEKAVMAMIWDEELEPHFKEKLGHHFDTLRRIIPPTFVVRGSVPANFPLPIKEWEDIARLSRKQRAFVLKTSGFSSDSSWAKGVTFLEKLSQEKCEEVIREAVYSEKDLFIIQQFRKGMKFTQSYFDFSESEMKTMEGRVRFTPYFSTEDGSLLTSKTTMCENTDYIHAMVDSISSPVSYA